MGLIPAHAGKTTPRRATRITRRAHPRSRGENEERLVASPRLTGSSPLTRGKQAPGVAWLAPYGLIPAHAGKTLICSLLPSVHPAHPRSRGENYEAHSIGIAAGGSSPLTRGKRVRDNDLGVLRGLIPAHAGKTQETTRWAPSGTAHPRSRGENDALSGASSAWKGSSPLTRGKLPRPAEGTDRERLIPAHAGKTMGAPSEALQCRAHPRSRGENARACDVSRPSRGSSPLTRGKHSTFARLDYRRRLIPAHAGKTLPDLRFYRADRSDLGKP